MNPLCINLEQALKLREQGALLVDARSESEFADGSIPGAINVPLLDDAQRAEIGTLYKQRTKQEARLLGVKLVAPKIPAMVDTVLTALGGARPPVVVFCWRGGMRSRSLTTFLELAGIPARQLEGGHKAFRSHVRAFFETGLWGRLLVLRGMTGVGKTRLLCRLGEEGYPVLDLEGLANHRGSAFGALGLGAQPSQKQFEAELWDALRRIPPDGYALAEGESRNIGRLTLPKRVHQTLQLEPSLWIEASLEYRSQVILEDYPARDRLRGEFVAPIRALKSRLGSETMQELLQLLEDGQWQELVQRLMVEYYDPLYRHTKPEERIEIAIEPESEGLSRLRGAIAELLARPPRLLD